MENACTLAELPRIPCLAHCLHNAILTTLDIDYHSDIQELVNSCHSLAKLFHSSPKMAQLLQGAQERLNPQSKAKVVMMDVVTRWNSTLAMLERLKVLQSAIDDVLNQLEEGEGADPDAATKLRHHILSQPMWRRVDILIDLLKPLFNTTQIYSSSDNGMLATMAPWIMATAVQLHSMNLDSPEMRDFHDDLVIELENRVELTDKMFIASVFHPSFHNLWYVRDPERVELIQKTVRGECMRLTRTLSAQEPAIPPPAPPIHATNDNIFSYLETEEERTVPTVNSAKDEVARYFDQPRERSIVDPFVWWKEHKQDYPLMAQLARKYLAMPATSVASERMFSFAGNTVSDKRTRLTCDAVSDIVFSRYATKCITSSKSAGYNV